MKFQLLFFLAKSLPAILANQKHFPMCENIQKINTSNIGGWNKSELDNYYKHLANRGEDAIHKNIVKKHLQKYQNKTFTDKVEADKVRNAVASLPLVLRNKIAGAMPSSAFQLHSELRQNNLQVANLDTLAQLQTVHKTAPLTLYRREKRTVQNLDTAQTISKEVAAQLRKRAAAKYLTLQYLKPLIALDSSLKNSYKNSVTCCETVINSDGKLTSAYCKNRWCIICCRNKTANLINGYNPIIETFQSPYFVTLSFKNCELADLRESLAHYNNFWRNFYNHNQDGLKPLRRRIDKYKKLIKDENAANAAQLQTYKEILNNLEIELKSKKLRGIKKIECTYNAKRNDYHPHAHILVNSKDYAEQLYTNWFKYCKDYGLIVSKNAQDVKAATAGVCKELFKYCTKMATPTGKIAKIKKDTPTASQSYTVRKQKAYYIAAMDNIFNAMKNMQVFTAFGINKIVDEDKKEAVLYNDVQNETVYRWMDGFTDWANVTQGELLSGYRPSKWEIKQGKAIVFSLKDIHTQKTKKSFIEIDKETGKKYILKGETQYKYTDYQLNLAQNSGTLI